MVALVPRRARTRLLLTLLVGALAEGLVGLRYGRAVALLAGFNAGGLFLMAMTWLIIASSDHQRTRQRAAAEDPGRTLVYALVIASSVAGLLSGTLLARRVHQVAPTEAHELLALCLITVALSWALTHSAFTLRYAHLYYREDGRGRGGVEFAGGEPPTYFDFAYLAFTVGMCFQVSDVTISNAQIRQAVLLHGVISFAYNTAILAFALNLAFAAG